jgi:hypothetical protein
VDLKNSILLNATPCGFCKTRVSDELIVYIIRVKLLLTLFLARCFTLMMEAVRSFEKSGSYKSHTASHPRRRHSSYSPHQDVKSYSIVFVDVERPLLREDGTLVYNCWWSSKPQSFSGSGSSGLNGRILLSRIRDPLNLKGQVLQVQVEPVRHWVPISSRVTIRRAKAEVIRTAYTRNGPVLPGSLTFTPH